ncbi:HAD family hydrolase [uncultured Winogradskyella sp.]|uniref:HAD family hydrolase n=1 Tax=uncultured Winogradskyella sp. TaxID=395353 RepID=UPI0026179840|nr:HAD family hydrolase [uncultured Winogradskyella sp.]
MDKKVLVVDLDGTLYNTNTFHEFLKYLLSYYFNDFRMFKFNILLFFIKLRLFRMISHSRLKYKVLGLIKNEDIDYQDFVSKLLKHKNKIEEVADSSFDVKILATAAPSCYANWIAKAEGFDVCLATDFPEYGFTTDYENLSERKKENLLGYFEKNNFESVDVFITDHMDDAPIIKIAKKNIIINPNHKLSNWLKENLINFEVRKTK